MAVVAESCLVEQGADRDPLSENDLKHAHWCLDPPLSDSLETELMCSGGQTIKAGTGLPSLLSPSVTQTGLGDLALYPLAPSLWPFSTGSRTMCLGPEHPFNQGGSGWAQP